MVLSDKTKKELTEAAKSVLVFVLAYQVLKHWDLIEKYLLELFSFLT